MELKKHTLDCVLQTLAETYGTKDAILFEDIRLSYEELYTNARKLACGLQQLGIVKNTKVAILLPNCLEYVYVYFAQFLLGSWAVPLSTRYEYAELQNIIADSDIDAIIFQDRIGPFHYTEILSSLKPLFPNLKQYICLSQKTIPSTIAFNDLFISNASTNELACIEEDDVAILAYTSGTTGSPKGVMIPHRNLVLSSAHTAQLWDLQDKDVVAFSIAPLYAAQGFLAVLIDLVAGITMKWISSFNPHDILAHLIRQEVGIFHTQPTMWNLLMSLPAFSYIQFTHLKKVIVSGSLCSTALAQRIQQSVGCTLLNAYGLIEATGVVTVTRPDDPECIRLNTVGKPIPGVEIKIVDSQRQQVACGQIGELAVRGYLMKGYYKNELKTKEIIDGEGWLYTGDLACLQPDGENIAIVGRCKDMVIRGGFNVYPIDIEECLLTNDKIYDVSVVGKPDEILGEILVAFVIPKPGETLFSSEVKMFCRGKIANYKIPDEVLFVSQFPLLLSGKVQKNILASWAINGIETHNRLFFDGIAQNEMNEDF